MSRHCSARFVYGLQLGTNPPKFPAASSALSLPLTHCLLFCVSDSRAVTSETSSLRCHHHTEFSSLYPRDAPFSLSSYSFLLCIPDKSDYERPRHVEAQETKPPPLHLVLSYRLRLLFFFLLDRKLYDDDNTVIRSLNNAPLCCLSTRHGQEPFIIFKRSSYSASDA